MIDQPVRTLADVERLRIPDPEEAFGPVLEAVSLVRAALRPDQAVVGFCGGPFTVAGYLVEGKPSREFALTKSLMLGQPEVWHALLAKLAETFAAYVAAKARAGADVIQLFDSWVGALSPAHYREHVAPHSARVLAAVDVPTIHFGTGTATLLEEMAAAGGDVIGLDWRIPLDTGWARVPDRAVQGNLDPAVLLAPWAVVEAEARDDPRPRRRPAGPHLQPRARRLPVGRSGHADPPGGARPRGGAGAGSRTSRRDRERDAHDAGSDLRRRRLAPLPGPRPRDAHAEGSRRRARAHGRRGRLGACATSRPRSRPARPSA